MSSTDISKLVIDLSAKILRYKHKFKKKANFLCDNNLNERQFHILFFVGYLKIHNTSEIAYLSKQSSSSISIAVSKLVKSGYLCKKYPSHEQDNRKVYIHITDEGAKKLEAVTKNIIEKIALFYEELSDTQKQYFIIMEENLLNLTPDIGDLKLEFSFAINFLSKETYEVSVNILKSIILFWYRFSIKFQSCNNVDVSNQLTHAQCVILNSIYTLDIHTISEMSSALFLTNSTLSITVSKLTTDGFLEKKQPKNEEDGRRVYFYITEKGIDALNKAYNITSEIINDYYEKMPELEKKYLYEVIKNLNIVFDFFM